MIVMFPHKSGIYLVSSPELFLKCIPLFHIQRQAITSYPSNKNGESNETESYPSKSVFSYADSTETPIYSTESTVSQQK